MQDFTSFFTTFSCFNVADWVSHVLVIFQISLAPAKKQPTLRLTGRCPLMAAYSLVSPQLLKCLFLRIDKNEWQIWTQRPCLCVIWHQSCESRWKLKPWPPNSYLLGGHFIFEVVRFVLKKRKSWAPAKLVFLCARYFADVILFWPVVRINGSVLSPLRFMIWTVDWQPELNWPLAPYE